MRVFIFAVSMVLLGVSTLQAAPWVSHHNMSATDYQNKFNSYTGQGYRLLSVEGYGVGSATFYTGIWSKTNGPGYVTHHGMSSADYQTKFDAYTKQGYRLVWVDGAEGRTPTFSAIWHKTSGAAYLTHHAMSATDYQNKFNTYTGQGYRLVHVSGYGSGSAHMFAAIWEKSSGPAYTTHHAMTSSDYQSKFNTYTGQGYRLTHINGYSVGTTDYYNAIWEKESGPSWSARHSMTSLGYQNEFENHLYTGYDLKRVSGYSRNGKAHFAALWHSDGTWSDADRNHINKKVQDFMKTHNVTGTSVSLIRNGRLVYSRGYGVMDKSTGEAVGPQSLFRVASVSKPITGAAMMKLSESHQGLLGQKVFGDGSILGKTYGTKSYTNWETQITVQNLLEHTAGGNTWNNKGDDGTGDPMFQQTAYSHSQLIGWVLDERNPEVAPGTKSDYSNFGFCVAGRVIEKKSGMTYENYVREHVFKPCGITNLFVAADAQAGKRNNEVTYYEGSPYTMKVKRMDAHGGWLGSALDLAKFLVRVDGQPSKPDIISAASYAKMVEPCSVSASYAKGWSLNGNNRWHNGSFDGSGAIIVNAGNGTSWVFLMNKRWVSDADGMMWDIVNGINTWPNHDWF